ncbi:hypothetical protein H5410_038230 [Solanum commersonii]|uniref:Uncharacterized protein n=1 Tax=Solanum commersonii TaxID=4109 RepID=A0A9J5YDD5_SOLCO|nr:hypothetical protein H5410_038230 [Solanum commersonii]
MLTNLNPIHSKSSIWRMCLNKNQVQMIWIPLISMQGTIIKGTPQSYGNTKKPRTIWPISEREVIETVASKFGGSRIAKEHTPDTSNYLTPRPQKSNLR